MIDRIVHPTVLGGGVLMSRSKHWSYGCAWRGTINFYCRRSCRLELDVRQALRVHHRAPSAFIGHRIHEKLLIGPVNDLD